VSWAGEARWVAQLGGLRNVIRQEVIRRQLADHVLAGMTVLDVGCGQGTQAIELAAAGCVVTGVEPSAALRSRCLGLARTRCVDVEVLAASLEDVASVVDGRRFDLVCAHGLLMYIGDRRRALAQLAGCVGPAGSLSVTFRNGHALAMRPALRGDWRGALAAFGSQRYTNELGIDARADLLDDVVADLRALGLEPAEWYGVRVFNDAVPPSATLPEPGELALILDAEHEAGRRDPYRWLASQIHLVATRRGPAT
jgi:S-adenosylmethionine-dependent methyltransferase